MVQKRCLNNSETTTEEGVEAKTETMIARGEGWKHIQMLDQSRCEKEVER